MNPFLQDVSMTNLFAHNSSCKIDVAIMTDIRTPSTSRSNASILDLLQAHLRENILVPSLIYFYCVCGTHLRPRAITKTELDDATRTMVTVSSAPSPVRSEGRRGGEEEEKGDA